MLEMGLFAHPTSAWCSISGESTRAHHIQANIQAYKRYKKENSHIYTCFTMANYISHRGPLWPDTAPGDGPDPELEADPGVSLIAACSRALFSRII